MEDNYTYSVASFNAWVPLLTYPAKDAPRFKKGFVFSICAYVAQFGITAIVWCLQRWEQRKEVRRVLEERTDESQQRLLASSTEILY